MYVKSIIEINNGKQESCDVLLILKRWFVWFLSVFVVNEKSYLQSAVKTSMITCCEDEFLHSVNIYQAYTMKSINFIIGYTRKEICGNGL